MPSSIEDLDQEEPGQHLVVAERGDLTVVTFTDLHILEEQKIQRIQDDLVRLVESGRHQLLLDLGQVKYIASRVLHTLIGLRDRLRAVGGRLTLCNVRPELYEVFQVTKLVNTEWGLEVLDPPVPRTGAPKPGP